MAAVNKNEKQIMDVTKPGKSAPSATAKPIIVGHGPMVQDPMVTSDTSAEAVAPAAEEIEAPVVVASPSASKKIISPISEEKAVPTEVPEVIVDTPTDNTDESVLASEESAVVDTIIDQVGSKAPATSDEDKKKHEHIEKLIAEKKYFVPLGKVNGKSNKSLLGLTVFLVAVITGVLLLLDAGIIKAGFAAPTNFFPDKTSRSLAPTEADVATIQQSTTAKYDTEREADIKSIHGQVEVYYAQNGRYPTLENINDKGFRLANLRNFDDAILKDPEGFDSILAGTAAAKVYSYDVQRQGGGTCDNVTNDCAQYTLTATLSEGAYTKQNLN